MRSKASECADESDEAIIQARQCRRRRRRQYLIAHGLRPDFALLDNMRDQTVTFSDKCKLWPVAPVSSSISTIRFA